MCGIAGILKRNGGDIPVHTLERMTDLLQHRGPDGRGIYRDQYIGLGHRRLAIIDLQGGKQPMSDPSGRFHITFNGEIYNYRELKKLLESKGHLFRTQSDTEILLHCFMEYGDRCPEKLNGMFAFAVWDKQERRLFLARDRSGIKPLYYAWAGDNFIFASEIKSLLAYPGLERSPNIEVVCFYLAYYKCNMGEDTLFNGIKTLEPGFTLTITPSQTRKQRYWILPIIPESDKEDKGEDYYIQAVRELVQRAVTRRMVSDVPLGAYLSGGIDSSIIVALMSETAKIPIKTFAIGFPEEGFNEFRFSDQVAAAWGADHTQITMEEDDYFRTLDELIWFKDSPLSVPNEVPLYLMSKILKESITVVLSGEGADELFGGYGGIMRSPIDYLRSLPDSNVPKQHRRLLDKALMRIYGKTAFDSEIDHFLCVYSWMKPDDLKAVLHPDTTAFTHDFAGLKAFWQRRYNRLKNLDMYNKYLYLMETAHLPGLLGRLDTTTMAASVEGRVPFTDVELLEFVSAIPYKYKLHWNSPIYENICVRLNAWEIAETMDTTKYILKRSFVGKVPPDVLFRKKYSFPVPLDNWFGKGLLSEFLNAAENELPHFLDKNGVLNWIAKAATNDKPLKVWMLLNLVQWYNKYFTNIDTVTKQTEFAAVV